MDFFAHSANRQGNRHRLVDHLLRTAELARSFAPNEKLEELFYLAGLLHDVGKFQDGFQQYLEHGQPRTPHADIGAFIVKSSMDRSIPLQFAVGGHHAGMRNNQDRISNNEEYSQNDDPVLGLIRRFRDNVPQFQSLSSASRPFDSKDVLLVECMTRFLFSALTDADWLDTERHFKPDTSNARPTMDLDYGLLLKTLEKEFVRFPTTGRINLLRTKARVEASAHSADAPGFFSLQLPTGLGKTLTSLYWALLHARQNRLKRIIIVLPYISIIDQTASILKGIFGDGAVLEHHSGVMGDEEEYGKETLERGVASTKQLACENWQAPIIVTTAVQFFESLFSNRPFRCRKNHSIACSVVIFDEVQTLPKQLAEPTIVMLKNVASMARTSFLFCTATMPAFGKTKTFDGIDATTSLISSPKEYFDATQRVNYKLLKGLKPVALDEVSKKLLKETKSYLVIVNTKSVAGELYVRLRQGETHEQYYHLSTAMCPHHRKKIISEIVAALGAKNRPRIAVVSTQLVEAGIDFDFPCVYRAIAPLESVIQAAGRCNRNGKMEKGKVVLFDLLDHRMPDDTYRTCAKFAEGIIHGNPKVLHEANSFERYYEQVTRLFVNPDSFGITEERKSFNFKTVDEKYRIIDNRTTPLFVDFGESKVYLDEVLEFFDNQGFISKEQYRRVQQYGVQVYPDFLKKYDSQIEIHKSGLRIWHGRYDKDLGIVPEDVETVF